MSVQTFIAHQAELLALIENAPVVYGLVGNSIWGPAENEQLVAVFDTEEMALAYLHAARLPGVVRTIKGQRTMIRSHRPDSLLWSYNTGVPI